MCFTLNKLHPIITCQIKHYEVSGERLKYWSWRWCTCFPPQSVPPHRAVHKEAQTLLLFLQLPAFPPISRQSLLHPALLSLRYLTDANLPGNSSTNTTDSTTDSTVWTIITFSNCIKLVRFDWLIISLPDELHPLVCRLMERAGMADQSLHTFDLLAHPVLPRYDVQTAALVVVTMKLVFGLDDHTEW